MEKPDGIVERELDNLAFPRSYAEGWATAVNKAIHPSSILAFFGMCSLSFIVLASQGRHQHGSINHTSFREHTIATDLTGGYQVVVSDVNHDGKPDLIAL